MRREAIDWGKIYAKDISDKGLLYRICKGLLKLNNRIKKKLNNRKANNLIKKWRKDLTRYLTKEDILSYC